MIDGSVCCVRILTRLIRGTYIHGGRLKEKNNSEGGQTEKSEATVGENRGR